MDRLGSKLIIFALALAFTAFAYSQRKGADIKDDPSWSLVVLKDAKAPQAVLTTVKARLAEQPLDQAKVNLLFASEMKRGLDAKRRDAFVNALISLGWRDTATQQNLVVRLLQSDDPSKAILRADGLLRRGRLFNEVIPMLVHMELFPDATDILVERLMRKPNWRKEYFAHAAPVPGQQGLDGRIRLLSRLMDKKDRISHEEIAPSLAIIVSGGMPEAAIRLGLRSVGAKPGNELLYDPMFAKTAALSTDDLEKPFPFEWEFASAAGVGGMIVVRDAAQAQLHWNGRGAPVIARTMTLSRDPRRLRLSIIVDSADALENLGELAFSLQCKGAPPVRFLAADTNSKQNTVHFVSEGAPTCSYPDFVISGQPQARDQSIETTISAIHLSEA